MCAFQKESGIQYIIKGLTAMEKKLSLSEITRAFLKGHTLALLH